MKEHSDQYSEEESTSRLRDAIQNMQLFASQDTGLRLMIDTANFVLTESGIERVEPSESQSEFAEGELTTFPTGSPIHVYLGYLNNVLAACGSEFEISKGAAVLQDEATAENTQFLHGVVAMTIITGLMHDFDPTWLSPSPYSNLYTIQQKDGRIDNTFWAETPESIQGQVDLFRDEEAPPAPLVASSVNAYVQTYLRKNKIEYNSPKAGELSIIAERAAALTYFKIRGFGEEAVAKGALLPHYPPGLSSDVRLPIPVSAGNSSRRG